MPGTKTLLRSAYVCLVLFVMAGPCRAQVEGNRRTIRTDLGETNPLDQLRQRMASVPTTLPMEGAVDPAEYVVGPGDQFSVVIGGPEPNALVIPVSADGKLVLPVAGTVDAAGKRLDEVEREALDVIRPKFAHVQVDVSLAQPRQFYVHVSGAVPVPGRYLVTPVGRVASVLELAYADTTQVPLTNLSYRPSLRNVRLIRRDGTERSLDLLRYFSTGNTDFNPYLRDGDVVSVPAFDPNRQAIFVDGAVAFPGTYDYRDGDTAGDVLDLAGANGSATGEVRIIRRHDDGQTETLTLSTSETGSGDDGAVQLQPRDHVYVVPDQVVKGTATVEGWVHYPGTYPIEPGRTTLADLLDVAGGLRPGALLRGAYLERNSLPPPEPRSSKRNRFEHGPTRPEITRPDTTAILQNLRLADFDFLSRSYFAQELRLQNRVSLDVEAALTTGADTVRLQDGDRLVVPRDQHTVYVFGQVTRPGFVAQVPGADAAHYIDAAGGRSPLAKDVYVVKAGTGQYLSDKDATIASGDMIFVDRRDDLAGTAELQRLVLEESRSRSDARIRTVQTVAQIISAIVPVIILIRSK